jgi:DNA mismatch endonuclease (patch repair protein)
MSTEPRKNVKTLPGKPDVVFSKASIAVFCDGDFWHGRNWQALKSKLDNGTNPTYWCE